MAEPLTLHSVLTAGSIAAYVCVRRMLGRKEEKKKVANAHTFGVSEVCVGERAFPRTTLSWAG